MKIVQNKLGLNWALLSSRFVKSTNVAGTNVPETVPTYADGLNN